MPADLDSGRSQLGDRGVPKVAFVTPYLPFPPDTGGKIRSFHLLCGLGRHLSVDLYTFHEGPQLPETGNLASICHRIVSVPIQRPSWRRWDLRRLWRAPAGVRMFLDGTAVADVSSRLRSGGYGLVVADEICMTPFVSDLPGPKVLIQQKVNFQHHLEVARLRRPGLARLLAHWDARRMRGFERRALGHFRPVVCCSEGDAELVRRLRAGLDVEVVANGVDTEYFEPLPDSAAPPTVLYLGTLDYPPNIDALQVFFRSILPLLRRDFPELRVEVVGNRPTAAVRELGSVPGVEVSGSVPDVRPYLAKSTLMVVPLRLGGGTRLKILECLAAGRPVVSTRVGAEGLELEHERHLLLADEPEEFARQTARLLRDPALRTRLVEDARPVLAARYSWHGLGIRFSEICRRAADVGQTR